MQIYYENGRVISMCKCAETNHVKSAEIVNAFKNQNENAKKQAFNKIWCEIINYKERQKST